MGRRRTQVGEHGSIRVTPLVDEDDWNRALARLDAPAPIKVWLADHPADVVRLAKSMRERRGTIRYVAKTDYRSRATGAVRRMQAEGRTEEDAKAKLLARVSDLKAQESGAALTSVSSLSDLFDLLAESINEDPALRPQSRERYIDIVDRFLRPRLSHLQVHDFDTATLNAFFRTLRDDKQIWAAKIARLMLSRAARIAIGYRAIDRNPVPDTIKVVDHEKRQRAIDEGPEVISPADLNAMRVALRDRERPGRNGPTPDLQLRSIFELYAALGRPGEVLALRIRDVDLTATPPTLTFAGTIVEANGKRYRQPTTKTSLIKTVALPPVLVAAVQRRLDEIGSDLEPDQLLFTTRSGEPHNRRDLATRLRRVGSSVGVDSVYAYLLRRTSGTAVSRDHGIEAAAFALGHAEGDTRTARTHYVAQQARVIDSEVTNSIERMMPTLDD